MFGVFRDHSKQGHIPGLDKDRGNSLDGDMERAAWMPFRGKQINSEGGVCVAVRVDGQGW
jgi:hypothetical protein